MRRHRFATRIREAAAQEGAGRLFGAGLARKLNDCRTCHVPAEDGTDAARVAAAQCVWQAIKGDAGHAQKGRARLQALPARVEVIADEDSDGDGVSNLLELLTGHFPGDADDRPAAAELAAGRRAIAAQKVARSVYPWNPFERVTRPEVPPGALASIWVRNPVDRFIAAEHEARGLTPRPEASRAVLLRRLYLDLTGLPPAPMSCTRFWPMSRRMLMSELSIGCSPVPPTASAGDGTGWTSGDIATGRAGASRSATASRTSGTGETGSSSRSIATSRMIGWSWRCSRPTKTRPEDLDALRATGYLARNFKLLSREKWMQDVVDHTGQAFLGVTFGCAAVTTTCTTRSFRRTITRSGRSLSRTRSGSTAFPACSTPPKTASRVLLMRSSTRKPSSSVRGDDRNPTGNPPAPGVPESLGGSFDVKPLALPLTAVQPDRRQDVIRAQVDAFKAALAEAEVALDKLERHQRRRRDRAETARRGCGAGTVDLPSARSSRPRRSSTRAKRAQTSGPGRRRRR